MSPVTTAESSAEKGTMYVPEAHAASVQVEPPGQGAFYTDAASTIFWIGQQADEMEPWGRNIKMRDRQLREFIPIEPLFNSALGIVMARNASFSWKLEGPARSVIKMQKVLQTANFGRGWSDLVGRLSVDLYTQDSGAFVEIIRAGPKETDEVIGLAHLDAQRCYATGVPDEPVVYQDRNGRYHRLRWYQVMHLTELPATWEGLPGLQYCALTRMLRAVRIIRDIGIYLSEKLGGRNARSVTAVKGITPSQMSDAMAQARNMADASGLIRFQQPIIVGAVDPKADIGFETLELASIPDGFELDVTNRWYISQIAMAFLSDYQEFAPLPGGGLGTATQSDILRAKGRGKGPGLFMKLISEAMNWSVMPNTVEFVWAEQDQDADKLEAETRKMRAEERAARITSGELTPQVARVLAHQQGDLSKELLDALAQSEPETDVVATPNQPEAEILEESQQPTMSAVKPVITAPPPNTPPAPQPAPGQQASSSPSPPAAGKLATALGLKADWAGASQPRDPKGRWTSGGGGGIGGEALSARNPALGMPPTGDPVMDSFVGDAKQLGASLGDDELEMLNGAAIEIASSPPSSLSPKDRIGERPAQSLEKTQAESIDRATSEIRQRFEADGKEHGTIVREDGSRGPIWDGEEGGMNVDSWYAANQPIALHTHPNDLGLSIDDVASSMGLNIREIRAIGPTKTHIARVKTVRPDGKPNWDQAAAARTYNAAYAISAIRNSRKVKRGQPIDDEGEITKIWRKTAAAGNFTYEVRPT